MQCAEVAQYGQADLDALIEHYMPFLTTRGEFEAENCRQEFLDLKIFGMHHLPRVFMPLWKRIF